MKYIFLLINVLIVFTVNATGSRNRVFYDKNYGLAVCAFGDTLVEGTTDGIQIRNVNSNTVEFLNYENIGLPTRVVYSVAHSQDGTLWLGCDSGLIKLKGQTFYKYDMSNSPMLGNWVMSVYCAKNGDVWCASYANSEISLLKFDGQTWSIYNSSNSVINSSNGMNFKFVELSTGDIYFLCEDLYHFDGTAWSVFSSTFYDCMAVDSSDNLYLTNGSTVFKVTNGIFSNLNSPNPAQNEEIFVDSLQNVWVGKITIGNKALYKYDGTSWTRFSAGIADYSITDIVSDINNNIWMTTIGGLQKFNGTYFNIDYEGMPTIGDIQDVIPNYQNKLWVAGGVLDETGGISSYDGENWTAYTQYNSGLFHDNVVAMEVDSSGIMWILSIDASLQSYIYKFNGSTFTLQPTINSYYLRDIQHDSNDNMWLNSYYELIKINGTTISRFDSTNVPGLNDGDPIREVAIDSMGNKIWLLCISQQTSMPTMLIYDGVNWSQINVPITSYFRCMALDAQNKIWIGTNAGIYCYDGSTWINYTTSNSGLLTNDIKQISFDRFGNMYYADGFSSGVFDGVNWSAILPPFLRNTSDCNRIVIDRSANIYYCDRGTLWIHNDEGLRMFKDKAGVKGNVFYDANNNGVKEVNEPGMLSRKILFSNDGTSVFTDRTGDYYAKVDTGTIHTSLVPGIDWNVTSDSTQYTIPITDTFDHCCYDYGMFAINSEVALKVHLTGNKIRCARDFADFIDYENSGTVPVDGRVLFLKDTVFSYVGSSPIYNTTLGDTLVWNFTNLLPGESRRINVALSVPAGVSSYNSTNFATIDYDSSSIFIRQYSEAWTDFIFCSFDPNDKLAKPNGIGPEHYILKTDTIDYIIRFENCGNDTAYTIRVDDLLSSNLDLSTFKLISSSHPVNTSLKSNGELSFLFDNIYLPDKNTDPILSNGFVRFSIIPNSGLADHTLINNTASIYFDYNDPIYTNTTWQTLMDATTISVEENTNGVLPIVYPNPFTSDFKIKLNDMNGKYKLTVFTIDSKTIYEKQGEVNAQDKFNITINGSFWPTGIYFYRIESINNGKYYVGKVVKM